MNKKLNQKTEAEKLLSSCRQQWQTSQFDSALNSCQQALNLYQQIYDRQGEGNVLNNFGATYLSMGNFDEARKYYEESLAIAREIQDSDLESKTLNNLGIISKEEGNYPQASEHLRQSLRIARELKDIEGEAQTLGELASTYVFWGDYLKAIEYQQESLKIAQKISDRRIEASALSHLGLAYFQLAEYDKAITSHQQSWAIFKELGYRLEEAQTEGNLGNNYQNKGEYKKALEHQKRCLAIAQEINARDLEANARQDLGIIYKIIGDYTNAIKYLEQSLDFARKNGRQREEGECLAELGNIYKALGEYDKAIDYLQQSLSIARNIDNSDGEGATLNGLAITLRDIGKLSEAKKYLYQAINIWESIRASLGKNDAFKVSIFEKQTQSYQILQQVLIAQNKTNEALEIAERGRARAFVELLAAKLSPQESEQLNITSPNLEKIKQIAKAQNATLVEYSIFSNDFVGGDKTKFSDSSLNIWVINPIGEIIFRCVNLKPFSQKHNNTLEDLIINTRNSLGVSGREWEPEHKNYLVETDEANLSLSLKKLYQFLIQPISDLLPTDTNAKVIFIPQGALFLLPFPALQDEFGKYLIEKHTILTTPSIQVLDLIRQQTAKVKQAALQNVLVLGNPTMSRPELDFLPGAEQEAKAIASLFHTQAMTGNNATKTAIVKQMPQAKIIHLATHGIFDDLRGLDSAIALAPSGQDDGLLTAAEILNLNLNAELVVLSACNTGRGRLTGDGVIGLSRSLISAGVSSVIVSLWAVPDSPTALLMKKFYENLQKSLSKAQALRQAMLVTMEQKEDKHPKNWAAFTLVGDTV